ncbi:21 kDa protein-like [Punica granatum]|uniref:21 kDa protein-like n=2 Tax=Punica granatum TaxID=22663 RepID=A0A6P8CDP6_PUNGR|nr:21 kDa protein-like [Punica granatum]
MEGPSTSRNSLAAALVFLLALFSYSTTLVVRAETRFNTEFIRTSCSKTTYPRLCFSSLSRHASLIQTSPKLLAGAALNGTLDATRSTSGMMLKLSRTLGMTARQIGAMKDCVEELADSVEELRRSIAEMSRLRRTSDFGLVMNDIETWVSAALTDETTCSDGFAGKAMNSKVKNAVRGQILTVAHLTSNALALINRFAALNG